MTEKSFPQPSSPHTPSRRFTRYSLIWAGAALVSLLYLVLLATQPTLVAGMLGAGAEPKEATATQKALDETVAEVRSLRDTIDLFRNELVEVRAQVSNQSDVTRELTTRLSTLETKAAEPANVAEADTKAKDTKKAKEAPTKEAAAKKTPAKREIETGSVAQKSANAPITFGPPVVTPAAAPPASNSQIGVQIATGPSVDSLRLSWTLLNERHGTTLSALEPRYMTDGSGSERSYDLVVGPVASADEARRLCQELSLRATPCTVSRFTGDAL
ncbi:hypothetical protein [Hyphomicrobium sp. CS1GBMeth3]|uniref:hypothetical protein n=1 Tax=Hyphomicrobium sp. CS1GBMeth3 TaxID=1892845 RepID=UPI0009317493|nr:hypothetical protein [Hyphomicrobium sp. CS1GBMeth3]